MCVRVTVSRANLSCLPHATCDGLECMCSAFGFDVNTFLVFQFFNPIASHFSIDPPELDVFSLCCGR